MKWFVSLNGDKNNWRIRKSFDHNYWNRLEIVVKKTIETNNKTICSEKFEKFLFFNVIDNPVNSVRHPVINARLSRLGATKSGWSNARQSPPAISIDDKRPTRIPLTLRLSAKTTINIKTETNNRVVHTYNTGIFASVFISGTHHLRKYS